MEETTPAPQPKRWRRAWPWLVLIIAAIPALWHVVDFPDDLDPEFPQVERPTMSRRPPPAYRLAEPGDTIDRVAIYVSAWALLVALCGTSLGRKDRALWVSAVGLSMAAFWHASTPGPTFDGWHGLGWRAILDTGAPAALRVELLAAAVALTLLVVVPLLAIRARWGEYWAEARRRGVASLLIFALVATVLRQFEIPGVEPVGYWPRWAFVLGLIAFALVLVKCVPIMKSRARRVGLSLASALAWCGLVTLGIDVTWYHRPLERLKAVVPGQIYMSAMPTARGLEVAHERHHFKTIINLFPEDTPLRSPRLPEELRFAKEHGIHYVGSPSENTETASNGFLDKTLELAQDPDAWPILVHCHGCMDRTPAWVGIYRFLVQKRPLGEILTEIERHRGYRPKASVILLYNRVLFPRDPERYANDPTAAKLLREAPASSRLSAQPPADGGADLNREPPPRVTGAGASGPDDRT